MTRYSRKSTHVINNINGGSVPFRCLSKPSQKTSIHNIRALEQLIGVQPLLMLCYEHFSALKCLNVWCEKVIL